MILIFNASTQPYFNIGVKYGGIKYNGHEYVYLPPYDAFLRKDYAKKFTIHMKQKKGWENFVEIIKNEEL